MRKNFIFACFIFVIIFFTDMRGVIMEKRMLSPAEICDYVVETGVKKGNSSFMQLFILGIAAGASIALGGFAASMASHSIDNAGLAKFISGAVFPIGLMIVLICGGELFTGNTLMGPSLFEGKIKVRQVLKNWTIVYFSNFLGAFLIAFLVFQSGLLDTSSGKLGGYVIKTAVYKSGLTFNQAFAGGILCNILVCLAVWASYAAKDIAGKILIIWFLIMAFVLSGFEHSVANMYYFSIGLMAKSNSVYVTASHVGDKIANLNITNIIGNLVPVTLGNIIGGFLCVGALYWTAYKYIPSANSNRNKTLNR